MGGMIAAEMAAIAPNEVSRLALIAPAGLWLDQHPMPDFFAMLPFELPPVLFYDPEAGGELARLHNQRQSCAGELAGAILAL